MLDSLWTFYGKFVDCVLNLVSKSFHEVAHEEIASAIKAVMAVNSDIVLFCPALLFSSVLLTLAEAINQFDKCRYFFVRRWYLMCISILFIA